MLRLGSGQRTETSTRSEQCSDGHSLTRGETSTRTGSRTETVTDGRGGGRSASSGRSHGQGGNESRGQTISYRLAQVHRVVRELQQTGHLREAVADQLEEFGQILYCLEKRCAVALSGSEPALVETVEVPDPFVSAEALMKAVVWMKRELAAIRPYLFVPDLSPSEEERRIRTFLGEGPATGAGAPDIGPGPDAADVYGN